MLLFVDIPTAGKGTIATDSEAKAQDLFVLVDIRIAGIGAIATGSEASA